MRLPPDRGLCAAVRDERMPEQPQLHRLPVAALWVLQGAPPCPRARACLGVCCLVGVHARLLLSALRLEP